MSQETRDRLIELAKVELQDDITEQGGVSFVGETLEDFLYDIGHYEDFIEGRVSLEDVNDFLEESGIKRI